MKKERRKIDVKLAEKFLLEVHSIFENSPVPLILAQGILLGIVRENRILPWDLDIDLYTVSPNSTLDSTRYTEIVEVVESLNSHGFKYWEFYQIPSEKIVHWSFDKSGVRLCLKILCPSKKSGILCETGIYMKRRRPTISLLPARFFEKPATIEFLGKTFLAPNPIKEYLKREYGNWKIPERKDKWKKKRGWPTFLAKECLKSPWKNVERIDAPARKAFLKERELAEKKGEDK